MTIKSLVPIYLTHLRVVGRSPYTIKNARSGLRDLLAFLAEEQVEQVEELSAEVLADYQQDLAFRLTARGTLLCLRTQAQRLGVVRSFTRFLTEHDYLLRDPGATLTLPKKPRQLPRVILTLDELQRLLTAPDLRTHRGYRDRIVLELLYDTAIRRSELSAVRIADLDLQAGYLRVHGKGGKDRVVPVSVRVCDMLRNYLLHVRPAFLSSPDADDPGALILNRWGQPMSPDGIWAIVKRCVALAGLNPHISPHTFRHSCATHMLKNGAPVRHLQEMLGHESLESTQIYTHVTINDLKAIHAQYHPSDTLTER
jgi:integrase/recombinase XerD